jgi:hypothetical protein
MELAVNSQSILDLIREPWHWSVAGVGIAIVFFLLNWMGRSFGLSTSFKAMCSIAGAGKVSDFFKMNLKEEGWRLSLVAGALIGGYIGGTLLANPEPVALAASTVEHFADLGINYPEADRLGRGFVPTELFNIGNIAGVLMAIAGGFLVGFGARYADGCTSGHAITGLAHLQLPSLVTVVGFFVGGLLMTHLIFPFLMNLIN